MLITLAAHKKKTGGRHKTSKLMLFAMKTLAHLFIMLPNGDEHRIATIAERPAAFERLAKACGSINQLSKRCDSLVDARAQMAAGAAHCSDGL